MAAPGAITYNTTPTNCSMSMFCTTAGNVTMDITSAQLLAGAQSSGPLFDFLNATYASAALADTAFRNVLGELDITSVGGTGGSALFVTAIWVASSAKPALQIVAGTVTNGTYEILLRVSHTMIR